MDIKESRSAKKMNNSIQFEPLLLHVGLSIVPLFNDEVERISDEVRFLRRTFADRFGFTLPAIRILDHALLTPSSLYEFKINELTVSREELHIERVLAIQTAYTSDKIDGISTNVSFSTQPAFWIEKDQVKEAEEKRYQIMSPKTVLVTHLSHALENHMHELVTRQSIADLLEQTESHSPAIVYEIEQAGVSMSLIQIVVNALLKERISIRNFPFILETILTWHDRVSHTNELINYVRKALIPTILEPVKHNDRRVYYYEVEHEQADESFVTFIQQCIASASMLDIQPIFLLKDDENYDSMFHYLHERSVYAILLKQDDIPFGTLLQKLDIFSK
jgi:flagellar biosynthesis protein FlhA